MFVCICQRNHKQISKTTTTANCNLFHCLPHIEIYNTLTKQSKQTNKQTKQFRIRLKQWMCGRRPPSPPPPPPSSSFSFHFIPFHLYEFYCIGFCCYFPMCSHFVCLLLSPYFLMFLPHRELTASFLHSFEMYGMFFLRTNSMLHHITSHNDEEKNNRFLLKT